MKMTELSHIAYRRMLLLPKYPVEGASSRYCLHQFVPFFEQQGIHCTVSSFMDAKLFRASQQQGGLFSKLTLTLMAFLRRIYFVLQAHRYDVVFMHRELVPGVPAILEKLIVWQRVPIVFIYDDALFLLKENQFNPLLSLLKRADKIEQIFSLVDCVIGTNSYLAEKAAPFCKNSICLEIPENLERLRVKSYPSNNPNKPPVIGWIGSPSTEKYLKLVEPVLEKLAETHQFTLKIVGGGEYSNEKLQIVHKRWSLDDEPSDLTSFDIGIMPLPQEEWSLGKSGGKARTYMAAGIPPVCTAIGYGKHLIKHEETGYLVGNDDEWLLVLRRLIEQPEERRRVGENARRFLEENLNLASQGTKLLRIFNDVAARR